MSQAALGTELVPGRLIAGRFRLERPLARGGMGAVWVAHHLNLRVDVALKFIDDAPHDESAALRFAREATAAAKVKSPHVVDVLDFGADAFGRPYLAMELLRGEGLAARLERAGRLPLADVCRVVVHACRGLARAHAAGVVHRDLKPDNIFLVDDDEGFVAKVLDFGIAKVSGAAGAVTHHTKTGHILGTPLFMSPEQALGRDDVDFRSDLYSLGVVAFRCLAGELPFAGEALGEIIVKINTEPVPSVCARRPGLPAALDAWFRKALHKKPAKRFGSARQMAEALLRASGLPAGGYMGSAPLPAPPAAQPGFGLAEALTSRVGHETLRGTTSGSASPASRAWGVYGAVGLLGALTLGPLPFLLSLGSGRASPHAAAPSNALQAPAPPRAPEPPRPAPRPAASPTPAPSLNAPPEQAAAAKAPPEHAAPAAAKATAGPRAVEGRGARRGPRPQAPPSKGRAAPPDAPLTGKRKGTDWGI